MMLPTSHQYKNKHNGGLNHPVSHSLGSHELQVDGKSELVVGVALIVVTCIDEMQRKGMRSLLSTQCRAEALADMLTAR